MHRSIDHLSLEDKVTLLTGNSFWTTRSIPDAGVEGALLTDGPHGVRLQQGDADHLGINSSAPATAFPPAATTGSSWDPRLLEEMGVALGRESLALGVDVLLGPGINIKRSPLGGRNFEYFSEDPLLSGALGAGWVRGIESQGVGASVKHFAANNQETDRMSISADVDERTLREIYFPAFERTVNEARPSTVMCSYNKINGVYASQNSWLLSSVLRDDWGFDGYVVSDWGAVVDPVAAVEAGLDLEMPGVGDASPNAILQAVRDGRLSEATIDTAVSRILETHDRLRARRTAEGASFTGDEHHALARRIATESTVLLRNEGNLLPLSSNDDAGSLAVIGEFARTPRFQGAGSSFVNPTRLDSALDALAARTSRPVTFAAGFRLDGERDDALLTEAVAAARDADTAVLFLGLPPQDESEGFDREHMDMSAVQQELAAAVVAVNPRTVVVLSNGAVVTVTGVLDDAPAIIEAWLGGQAGGSAIADVLFGDAEPGGRLAETIPHALSHTPAHINWPGSDGHVLYGERLYVGYRWYDSVDRDVAFPFGYGLSYTSFEYSDLTVDVVEGEAAATVSFAVTNTGERAGSDVAQLYVGDSHSRVDRPVRELRGFEKVRLQPGESERVTIELGARAFAYWGSEGWVTDPGDFTIEVGRSSREIVLSGVASITVPPSLPRLDGDSTVNQWMEHPKAAPILAEVFAGWNDGGVSDTMGVDTMKLVGGMPLRTLLTMTAQAPAGSEAEAPTVEGLLAKLDASL